MNDNNNHTTAWYLYGLQAFAAWLAALFLLLFFAALVDFDLDSSALLWGLALALLVGAFYLQHKSREVFVNHLALVFVLCAKWLIVLGLEPFFNRHVGSYFGVWLVLDAALLWAFRDTLMRFVLAVFLMQALLVNAYFYRIMPVVYWVLLGFCCWAFVMTKALDAKTSLLRLLAIAGFIVLLLQDSLLLISDSWFFSWYPEPFWSLNIPLWFAHVLFFGWLLFFIGILFPLADLRGQLLAKLLAFVIACLLVALYFSLPQAVLAVALLLLGFSQGSKKLQALAAFVLLCFVSVYYYDLSASLLDKSWALLQMAAVFLSVSGLLYGLAKKQGEHHE